MSNSGYPPRDEWVSALRPEQFLRRPLGTQAEGLHSLRMRIGQPRQHPTDFGQIRTRALHPTHEEPRERISLRSNTLGLTQRFTHQPSTP